MCRKNGVQWEVFLSDTDECRIGEVRQGKDSLDPKDGEYCLRSFRGVLSVTLGHGQDLQLPLADDGRPLIFKLSVDWEGPGRRIDHLTHGHFIVITPQDWDREGHPPVEPEDCTDAGFRAHYFHRTKDESGDVAFKQCPIALSGALVSLQGHRLFDDSDEGPLFGGKAPPTLADVSGVVWARVGQEGDGGWRGENFLPAEQTLADTLNGRQGRFFVRVYDEDASLLDSDEFRYFRGLEAIHVNDERYTERSVLVPGPKGHRPTKIRFAGADMDMMVQRPTGHATASGDSVVVDPVAKADIVVTCAPELSHVGIKLHLPRIWWRMEGVVRSTDDAADQWCDRPREVTRHEFAEYADGGATLHVLLPRRFTKARLGFDDEQGRFYKAEKGENGHSSLVVALENFSLYRQIVHRLGDDALLCVEIDTTKLPLVRVLRDPMPKVQFSCHPVSTVNLAVQAERDQSTRDATPVASVRGRQGKWRPGKGFSYGELRDAPLAVVEAKRRSIRIDKRRRTTHIINVAAIRTGLGNA